MKRIDKLAKDIAEEYSEGRTDTLTKLIKRCSPCCLCSNRVAGGVEFIEDKTGDVKYTTCKAVVAMNNGDFSLGCDQGITSYLEEEVE